MKNATATSHGRRRLLLASREGAGAGFGMERETICRKYSEVGLENVSALLWDKLQLGVSSSDVHSRSESPPWTAMTGTIRLGKGVRREAESEESR